MANDKMTNLSALEMAISTLSTIEGYSAEALEKLTNVKNSYAKKSGTDKAPTKAQKENIEIGKSVIAKMEIGKDYSASDLVKLVENAYTSQKLAPIMTKAVDEVTLTKITEKGSTFYRRLA